MGGNASGDRRSLHLRVGADVAIVPRLRLMGNAAWERGQYNRIVPSFLTTACMGAAVSQATAHFLHLPPVG